MTLQKNPHLKITLVYWISTAFVALTWAFGGISSLLHVPTSMAVYHHLGYPNYFSTLLGTAQILGVIAVFAPVSRLLREWAYAGLVFDAIAATASILAVGSSISQITFPVIALAMVLVSHRAWQVRLQKKPE